MQDAFHEALRAGVLRDECAHDFLPCAEDFLFADALAEAELGDDLFQNAGDGPGRVLREGALGDAAPIRDDLGAQLRIHAGN